MDLSFRKSAFRSLFILLFSFTAMQAQEGNSDLGAWYGYFFNTTFKESSFGIMGDVQHRNFKVTQDFQQLILRAGLTYKIKETPLKLIAGYSYFSSGTYGSDNTQVKENRFYQDLMWNQKIGKRVSFLHRIRVEERFIENQDFRIRYRYMMNAKLALNTKDILPKTFYLWGTGEVFVNGQQQSTSSGPTSLYDRTWLFSGLGYQIDKPLHVELGYMREITDTQTKGQLIVSLFQTF